MIMVDHFSIDETRAGTIILVLEPESYVERHWETLDSLRVAPFPAYNHSLHTNVCK